MVYVYEMDEMDVLLARTVEVLSECSTLWNSEVQNVDTIDRVVLNLEEIHCDISGFLQQDHLHGDFDLIALQQCFSQLIVHWKTKLTHRWSEMVGDQEKLSTLNW